MHALVHVQADMHTRTCCRHCLSLAVGSKPMHVMGMCNPLAGQSPQAVQGQELKAPHPHGPDSLS